MFNNSSKRGLSVAAIVGAIVFAGTGGAVAATQIGSSGIADNSILSRDLADHNAVGTRDLKPGLLNLVHTHAADGKDGTNGVDGTDGKDGVDGTNGTDGVSGYEVRSYDYDMVSGGGIATMTCPVGKVATGGGYHFTDESAMTDGLSVVASYPGVMDWDTNSPKNTGDPKVDFRGWIIQPNKPNNINPGALTVYVVCMTAA